MQVINNHTELRQHVLSTLLYFDIFSYPLKAAEVYKFLRVNSTSTAAVTQCLDALALEKKVFRFGELYSLYDDQKNIQRRIKGNIEAEKWLKVATDRARFIGKFPFVRAVMASGSLSKGYMDEKSDLDFFIVTEPNRLWVARTLLVAYKRIFFLNSHKKFCVNYFVDTNHLEIEEQNLFTATELVTLLPLYNGECYNLLLASNRWLVDFFPNSRPLSVEPTTATPSHWLRTFSEFWLSPVSKGLDKLFMRMTLARWTRHYGRKFQKNDFDIAFKTRRHVSKNHPNHYQKKVLELYQQKLLDYQKQTGKTSSYD